MSSFDRIRAKLSTQNPEAAKRIAAAAAEMKAKQEKVKAQHKAQHAVDAAVLAAEDKAEAREADAKLMNTLKQHAMSSLKDRASNVYQNAKERVLTGVANVSKRASDVYGTVKQRAMSYLPKRGGRTRKHRRRHTRRRR